MTKKTVTNPLNDCFTGLPALYLRKGSLIFHNSLHTFLLTFSNILGTQVHTTTSSLDFTKFCMYLSIMPCWHYWGVNLYLIVCFKYNTNVWSAYLLQIQMLPIKNILYVVKRNNDKRMHVWWHCLTFAKSSTSNHDTIPPPFQYS